MELIKPEAGCVSLSAGPFQAFQLPSTVQAHFISETDSNPPAICTRFQAEDISSEVVTEKYPASV